MTMHIVPFVLLAAFSPLAVSVEAQQITWLHNPANGHWYGASDTTTSWSAGEALANSLGGHLVTIRNASEQAWIEANFAPHLGTHGLWIGFNDIAVEGQWVWVSGEPVTYTNWSPINPNNGSTIAENAAHLIGTSIALPIWQWNDETEWFDDILFPLIEVTTPMTPASYTPFGSGCAGSLGVPVLAPVGSELPQLGTTSHLRFSGLATNPHVAIIVIGFSNAQNSGPLGSYALPFSLVPLGFAGCTQYVSDDFTHFFLSLTGQVDWPLTVPQSPWLAGLQLHVQALSHESQFVAAFSNAVTATIGY